MNRLLAKWALDDALYAHWMGNDKEAKRILFKLIMRIVPEVEDGKDR